MESGILADRTWRWLKIRIRDLLGRRSRLSEGLGIAPRVGLEQQLEELI